MPVQIAFNLMLLQSFEGIVKFALDEKIEFAVVAPDDPLVLGCVDALEKKGIRATVRRKLGPDINASCGQLRRQHKEEN